jgi:hypothetical protein
MKVQKFRPLLFLIAVAAACQSPDTTKIPTAGNTDTPNRSAPVVTVARPDSALAGESFTSFWGRFRLAVLRSDTSQVIQVTEFPLETRGPNDDDTTIEFNKERFVSFFNVYLKQYSGMDLQGSTELDGIKKTETPKKTEFGKDQARVGDLVFMRIAGGWKLIFAYLNYETIDSLGK